MQDVLDAPHAATHGYQGMKSWPAPRLVTWAPNEARPGYDTCEAHEYHDVGETLAAKVRMLADMIRQSRRCIAYTGAGISTASGINDYATIAADTKSGGPGQQMSTISPMDAAPTKAHSVLTSMYEAGHLQRWFQQNHDGLPQKAGYPQHALNEIHGAWFDPSNPVVRMDEELRSDLFRDLLEWEASADLCLALGTSLAGMNADRLASSIAKRPGTIGTVIVNLQQTKMDMCASLRIFARIDDVMALLADELAIIPAKPLGFLPKTGASEQYWISYGSDGLPLPEGQPPRLLDLSDGQTVRIVSGPYADDVGLVLGRSRHGHYQIRFMHPIRQKRKTRFPDPLGQTTAPKSWLAPMTRTLGAWFVTEACSGKLSSFPIENVCESEYLERIDQSDTRMQARCSDDPRPGLPAWVREQYLQDAKDQTMES